MDHIKLIEKLHQYEVATLRAEMLSLMAELYGYKKDQFETEKDFVDTYNLCIEESRTSIDKAVKLMGEITNGL